MQVDLTPDAAIHNSMLRAAFADGADAAQLQSSIDSMQRLGVLPDQQSYTILLRAHGRQGDAQGAAAVMSQLLAAGECIEIRLTSVRCEVADHHCELSTCISVLQMLESL